MTPEQQRRRRLEEHRRQQNRNLQQGSMGYYVDAHDEMVASQPVNECPRIPDNGIQDSCSDSGSSSCD